MASVTSSTPTGNRLTIRSATYGLGRLVIGDIDASDPSSDYWAHDVGVDGAGASAEEAAVHVVSDDDLNTPDDTRHAGEPWPPVRAIRSRWTRPTTAPIKAR